MDESTALATLRNPAVGKAAITVPQDILDGKVWTM